MLPTKWDNEDGVLYSYVPGAGGYRFYEGQYYGDIWGFEFDRFFEVSDFERHIDGVVKEAEVDTYVGRYDTFPSERA